MKQLRVTVQFAGEQVSPDRRLKGKVMTTIRGSVLVGAVMLVASLGSAQAADLYDGGYKGSMKDAPVMSGPASWYIRGDIAWGKHDDPKMIEEGRFDLIETSMDSTWVLGGGVGRYFSGALRGDLTYDYRFDADVEGTQGDTAVGTFPGARKLDLQSHVFLANLYYDFNREGRFNPYLGVGLGFAINKTSGNTAPITGTACGLCGATSVYNATFEGDREVHVAAALMAGFSMKLRDKLHMDAGYRFLYLGQGHTGDLNGTITTGGTVVTAAGGDPTVEDIHAHEIRVGFRYDIR